MKTNIRTPKSMILHNAWVISHKAYETYKVGTIRDYLAPSIKQAWASYKDRSSKLRQITEINANADKLYSDNSRVYLGAELDENNNIAIAPKGFEVATMLFRGARKNLNAWVRDNKIPEHTTELQHEIDILDVEATSHLVTITTRQYNWLRKIMFNGYVTEAKHNNSTITYNIHREANGLYKLRRYIIKHS